MTAHPAVAQAAVIAREDATYTSPEQKQLVAYVVAPAGQSAEPAALRRYLATQLPDYLIPAAILVLESLPVTPNGKLDRKALPAPQFTPISSRAASTPQEEILVGLFAEVLGLERVGVEDNFFELGGHSLLTTRLIRRIHSVLGIDVAIRTLFEAPTVAQLTERLDGKTSIYSSAIMVPVQTKGTRPPLFCLHPATGYSWFYARLVRQFGSQYPIYALQARGLDGAGPLAGSMQDMVEDYVNEIRKIQTTGPYHLIGYSLGGILAQAIAARLRSQAQSIALLAVLDAYPNDPQDAPPPPDPVEALWLFVEGDKDAPPLEDDFDAYLVKVVQHLRDRDSAFAIFNEKSFSDMINVLRNNVTLFRQFASPVFDGHMVLFRATDTRGATLPAVDAWRPYVLGDVEVHDIPCHHNDMIEDQPLTSIATVILDKLSGLYPN